MSAEAASQPVLIPPPTAAKVHLRSKVEVPEYLPARMLNEFVYCPRRFFYEWVEGVFAESVDVVEGAIRHESIRGRAEALAPAEKSRSRSKSTSKAESKSESKPEVEPESEPDDERIHARSVTLSSERLKLLAVIDLVEGEGTTVTPVDYKRGSPRVGDEGPEAWPADRAQVCAQALILRDNGYTCDEAVLYYHGTRQRVRVPIDDALAKETAAQATEARRVAENGRIPLPLVDSPKCPRCSLVSICLPDETAAAMTIPPELDEDPDQLRLFELPDPAGVYPLVHDAPAAEVRRLLPARDDLRPLYVSGHGLSIGKSGDVLKIRDKEGTVQDARLHDISQVNIVGNVSLTSGAVQALCGAGKPVAYFSSGHWFYGLTTGMGLKNVFLRRDQFERAGDPAFCLQVARDIVSTKIRNQRTLMQRNHVEPPRRALEQLRHFAEAAQRVVDLEALLGVEGSAARIYFQEFAGMIKVDEGEAPPAFDFTSRNRRPPRDPVNALLSFGYSLLTRDLTVVCHLVGFDPFMGFYHQPRFGRPALALDLMEGFRPLVVDSAVLTAINGRMVKSKDFVEAGQSVALTSSGRSGFIRAYEQRMDTLVTHPLFGYRVSYRRVLEIQARLLARVVTGELARYLGMETR